MIGTTMNVEFIQALSLFGLACVVLVNTVVLNRMVRKIALVLTLMRSLSAGAGETTNQNGMGEAPDRKNVPSGIESQSSDFIGGNQS